MRDTTQLHPELQDKIAILKIQCAKAGLPIGISECLRTVAEQDALYAKGRTLPGPKVTNARGSTYSSMHQWGVAFDFYRNDGKGAYDDSDGFFTKVGQIGKSIGLEWGGNWISIKDKPHFQLPQWGSTTANLKAAYGTPDKFFETWKKIPANKEEEDMDYPTIKYGDKGKAVKLWQILVGAEMTGKFDKQTVAATSEWKKNHKLSNANGKIVGQAAWKKALTYLWRHTNG